MAVFCNWTHHQNLIRHHGNHSLHSEDYSFCHHASTARNNDSHVHCCKTCPHASKQETCLCAFLMQHLFSSAVSVLSRVMFTTLPTRWPTRCVKTRGSTPRPSCTSGRWPCRRTPRGQGHPSSWCLITRSSRPPQNGFWTVSTSGPTSGWVLSPGCLHPPTTTKQVSGQRLLHVLYYLNECYSNECLHPSERGSWAASSSCLLADEYSYKVDNLLFTCNSMIIFCLKL